MATKKAPSNAGVRKPAGSTRTVTKNTSKPGASSSKPVSVPKPATSTSVAKWDVQLSTGNGGSKVVQGSLGKTPAQRAKASNIVKNVAGSVSSSNVGGLLKGSGVSAPKSVTPSRRPSTPGKATGSEPLAPPKAASGVRPTSVARGTTASAAKTRAIGTSARSAQSVSKVSAKGNKKSSKSRVVRF